MMNINIINFTAIGDGSGNLTALEENKEIPFQIRRVYYITNVPQNLRRGFHSHRKLEQILICLNGSIKILVKTPQEEKTITLNRPTKGLYIGPMVWREMYDFSPNAVLLVLASEYYSEDDYIRNYCIYEKEATSYFEKDEF